MGLFEPSIAPFTTALIIMGIITALEVVGVLAGVVPSALLDSLFPDIDLDTDIDIDAPDLEAGDAPSVPDGTGLGPFSILMSWLCVGRVPVLVLIVAFLTGFGLSGWMVQGAVASVFGAALPVGAAVGIALAAALPATRWIGLGIARVMPKEETEAPSLNDFIGAIAIITGGTARKDLPAEAKLTDEHGKSHYVRIVPHDPETLPKGTQVILLTRKGNLYTAMRNPEDNLIAPTRND